MLEHHHTTTATTAEEALAMLPRLGDFDIVFCDLMMPEVTGMELYDRATSLDPSCAGKFVFMTGGVFTNEAASFVDRSEIRCISKPFTVDDLAKIMADLPG